MVTPFPRTWVANETTLEVLAYQRHRLACYHLHLGRNVLRLYLSWTQLSSRISNSFFHMTKTTIAIAKQTRSVRKWLWARMAKALFVQASSNEASKIANMIVIISQTYNKSQPNIRIKLRPSYKYTIVNTFDVRPLLKSGRLQVA